MLLKRPALAVEPVLPEGCSMRTHILAVSCLVALFLADGVLASTRVKEPEPTLVDLGRVWVGGTADGELEYFRLDLRPDGSGVFAVQYLPSHRAVAYRVTRTLLQRHEISFDIEPIDTDAEPVSIRGRATTTRLTLEVKGVQHDWKRTVLLQWHSAVVDRLRAVTERAEAALSAIDRR
jgi:hypothetical protein